MGAEKDSLRMLLACAPHAECKAAALAFGVEPAGCEGASADECEECMERIAGAVSARLLPRGMEWPRFEDGGPVGIGDAVRACAERRKEELLQVCLGGGGYVLVTDCGDYPREYGERVERPQPLPRDAYGEPVMVGDRVWLVPEKRRFCGESTEDCSLLGIEPGQALCVAKLGRHTVTMEQLSASCPACWLTHEEPDTQEAIDRDACLDPFEYVDRVMCKTFRDMSRSDARKEKFRHLLDRQLRLFREEEGR